MDTQKAVTSCGNQEERENEGENEVEGKGDKAYIYKGCGRKESMSRMTKGGEGQAYMHL